MQLTTQTVRAHYRTLRTLELPFHSGAAWRGALKSAADASHPELRSAFFGMGTNGALTSDEPRPWIPVLEEPRRRRLPKGAQLTLELRILGPVFETYRNQLEGLFARAGARLGNRCDETTPFHHAPPTPSLKFLCADFDCEPRHNLSLWVDQGNEEQVAVDFITPAHLRVDRKPIDRPSFLQLVRVAARRLGKLARLYGKWTRADEEASRFILQSVASVRTTHMSLRPLMWSVSIESGEERRRARGVVGSAIYVGPVQAARSLLRSAELLHLGRDITYGAGRIHVHSNVVPSVHPSRSFRRTSPG